MKTCPACSDMHDCCQVCMGRGRVPDDFVYVAPPPPPPPAPKPPKTTCFLWFHNWNKWRVVEAGKIMDPRTNAAYGSFIRQTRECQCCGKTQLKTQSSY